MTIETFRYQPDSPIRRAYEFLHEFKELFAENPTDNAEILAKRNNGIKERRAQIHAMQDEMVDKLTIKRNAWKVVYRDEMGETGYYYGIFDDDGETDEEIEEYCDSLVMRINSPYDCTGKLFTQYITWKRTSMGIRIIHAWGRDV